MNQFRVVSSSLRLDGLFFLALSYTEVYPVSLLTAFVCVNYEIIDFTLKCNN